MWFFYKFNDYFVFLLDDFLVMVHNKRIIRLACGAGLNCAQLTFFKTEGVSLAAKFHAKSALSMLRSKPSWLKSLAASV